MSRRLDRLVRMLQRREDLASVAKAQTARKVMSAEEILEEARRAQRELPAPAGQLRPSDLHSLRLRGLGAAANIERAEEALEERRSDDVDAERDRSMAAVRRRSVERLAERRRTVSVRTAAAASRRAIDELAALRQATTPQRKPEEG